MSSSSNPAASRHADPARLLARLLVAIAQECSLIGHDVAQLGGGLSDVLAADKNKFDIVRLQSFDALAQNAHAQAKLTAHIARHLLLGHDVSLADILEQIQDVPLPAVRQRLNKAIGGTHAVAETDDDMTLWIHDVVENGTAP